MKRGGSEATTSFGEFSIHQSPPSQDAFQSSKVHKRFCPRHSNSATRYVWSCHGLDTSSGGVLLQILNECLVLNPQKYLSKQSIRY